MSDPFYDTPLLDLVAEIQFADDVFASRGIQLSQNQESGYVTIQIKFAQLEQARQLWHDLWEGIEKRIELDVKDWEDHHAAD